MLIKNIEIKLINQNYAPKWHGGLPFANRATKFLERLLIITKVK